MVDYLLPIAKIVNVESYANQMFQAKSDVTGLSMQQILLLDYKTYLFNDQVWGIGVSETFYPSNVLTRRDELLTAMIDEKKKSHLTGLLFSIVDISMEQNLMIILGEPEHTVVQKTFNVTIQDGIADLGSRISRKKDIIPPLELYFKTNYIMDSKSSRIGFIKTQQHMLLLLIYVLVLEVSFLC
jgi:manganese-dependent inorganic pyrophosphatase